MDLPLALHTAARTFCANQHSRWSGEYMPLVESGQDRVGKGYSKAAYSLFPRYRLDGAIKIEVERITGQRFRSLEEARRLVLEAGSRAFSSLLQDFQQSPEARVALADEWKAFEAYISNLDADRLARIEPIPYQRVLAKAESEQLRQELSERWGAKGRYVTPASSSARTSHRTVLFALGRASGF
jgi:hypothetical protein